MFEILQHRKGAKSRTSEVRKIYNSTGREPEKQKTVLR